MQSSRVEKQDISGLELRLFTKEVRARRPAIFVCDAPVEAECDRQSLCQKIKELVDQKVAETASPSGLGPTEQPVLTPNESRVADRAEKSLSKSTKKGLGNTGKEDATASTTQMRVNGVSISLD